MAAAANADVRYSGFSGRVSSALAEIHERFDLLGISAMFLHMGLFSAIALHMRSPGPAQSSAMRTLRDRAALFVDMGQRSILDVENQHVPSRKDCWSGYQTLASLPVCWQLLTRWPLTHASQAYFSPSINIPAVERNLWRPIDRPGKLGYAQRNAARATDLSPKVDPGFNFLDVDCPKCRKCAVRSTGTVENQR